MMDPTIEVVNIKREVISDDAPVQLGSNDFNQPYSSDVQPFSLPKLQGYQECVSTIKLDVQNDVIKTETDININLEAFSLPELHGDQEYVPTIKFETRDAISIENDDINMKLESLPTKLKIEEVYIRDVISTTPDASIDKTPEATSKKVEHDNFEECFWSALENGICSAIPLYIKNIMKLTGYDSIAGVCSITEVDIQEMESFAKNEMEEFLENGEPRKNYYGMYATKDPKSFRFPKGHIKLIYIMRDYVVNKTPADFYRTVQKCKPEHGTTAKAHNEGDNQSIRQNKQSTEVSHNNSSQKHDGTDDVNDIRTKFQLWCKNNTDLYSDQGLNILDLINNLVVIPQGEIAKIKCFACHTFKNIGTSATKHGKPRWIISNFTNHIKTHFLKQKRTGHENKPSHLQTTAQPASSRDMHADKTIHFRALLQPTILQHDIMSPLSKNVPPRILATQISTASSSNFNSGANTSPPRVCRNNDNDSDDNIPSVCLKKSKLELELLVNTNNEKNELDDAPVENFCVL